ncbi:MAG TPA: TetR/AcrR family transcriptional regulator [Bryobacteraceae bacterium]|nr:TetR/AcrR family transcriptional regulator [Bryobacteraceae bacterium]
MPRTRSRSAHQKVLDAAIALLAERGVDGTSMDAIAETSGVSKATIYKHWKDKDQLLLEVMAELSGLHARPTFSSGDTRADMVAVLSYQPQERRDLRERITPHFVAYGARNPTFGDIWRNKVMEPPRRELKALLTSGIKKGEFPPSLDLELSLCLLLGPLLYRYIFRKKSSEDVRPLAEGVVEAFWLAYGKKTSAAK